MRTLGLDIGDRWVGVAMSDPLNILATPLLVFERKDECRDIQTINDIIRQYDVGLIIAGLPRSMDGKIGQQAEKVQAFVLNLSSQTKIPVEFRDERLSTISARRMMQDSSGKSRKKTRDDAAAAAIILQGYLEEQRTASRNDNESV
jgi:putative Holliday junction resolvase